MQSQQKRVKWSRGETAEALEERTDTGITQASVAYMENCIPDIYGNISRRPALKPIPLSAGFVAADSAPYFAFQYTSGLQVIPFYITETDIILVGIHESSVAPEFIRIQDGKVVRKVNYSGSLTPYTSGEPISYAQQNNYMVIATSRNVWKLQFTFGAGTAFTPVIDLWKFSGGWYAPNGTQTKQVNNSVLPNLNFSGHFFNYVYTNIDGTTTVYSNTDTGIDGASNIPAIKEQIPIGSIVHLANIGCYFRIEGYYAEDDNMYFTETTFDGVLAWDDIVPATNTYCKFSNSNDGFRLIKYVNGVNSQEIQLGGADYGWIVVKNSASTTGYSKFYFQGLGTATSPWVETDPETSSIRAYGALMTPVADENATDSIVAVEYGYVSLTPDDWSEEYSYPHPTKLVFNQQRLWAGGWTFGSTGEYALVIGSQIARYNDLKNDYNQENEPITLDILTQFKEKIVHLVDYNGLKIMTDAYEYAYESGGVVKQSGNGSWENCEPLVFESLCVYVDSTGYQIKAMQYEFQSNIFNSSTINQLTPHDLVWNPIGMAAYEDKIHSTGKYLFVVNDYSTEHPRLAVCNFVPSNQANIWSRWTTPDVIESLHGVTRQFPLINNVVNTKSYPIFMLNMAMSINTTYDVEMVVYPFVLDFDGIADLYSNVTDTRFMCVNYVRNAGQITESNYALTMPSADIAIYSDGVFQFMGETNAYGVITTDISQLTNVTAGLPINSKIISHPIDVGGKTKSIKKRIAKARMSVHNTEAGAITINDKTGYMNPAKDYIQFYGVTGMKQEVKYTITNKQGAMFHLESLLMNIEYGTLIS